jgi:FKBP-type peptidyl-prolyl cis-trans isomerase
MKRNISFLMLDVLVTAFFSCKENSLEKQRQNELKKLDDFIRAHYAEQERKPSGLYYIELEGGTGDSIKIGDRVQIYYDLWTLDSVYVSGTGRYEPLDMIVQHPSNLTSSAQNVQELRSLNEALTYMKKGSESRFIFDSNLGFGQYGSIGIPGFTPLMMEVEVYKVYPAQIQEGEESE